MHQIFESIRPDAKALGTVHSFTIESLSKKIGENTEDFRINVSNVLRHPVNYINSHFNLVKSAEGHQLYEHYERDLFNKALTLFPELLLIDCDNYSDFLAFTVSCLSVHNLIYDLNASDIPHYRMEDLTTNTDLLHNINGITISPKKSFNILKIWLKDCSYQNPKLIVDINGIDKKGCLFRRHNVKY